MIRVLRVLEYTYENGERFADDQARWTPNLTTKALTMQSSIVSITAVDEPLVDPHQYSGGGAG